LPHLLMVRGETRRICATSLTVNKSGQSSPSAMFKLFLYIFICIMRIKTVSRTSFELRVENGVKNLELRMANCYLLILKLRLNCEVQARSQSKTN